MCRDTAAHGQRGAFSGSVAGGPVGDEEGVWLVRRSCGCGQRTAIMNRNDRNGVCTHMY